MSAISTIHITKLQGHRCQNATFSLRLDSSLVPTTRTIGSHSNNDNTVLPIKIKNK